MIKLKINNFLNNGLVSPVSIKQNNNKLYVADQIGIIYQLNNKKLVKYLDLRNKIPSLNLNYDERGILDFDFYNNNIIVYYSQKENNRLSIFNNNKKEQEETILTEIKRFKRNIHNGGRFLIDKDYVYLGIGDGGPQKDPYGRAQNLNSDHGKILRIDLKSGNKEIYASGIRNPWGISKYKDTIYFVDVGYETREEVNILKRGNYGWNIKEGTLTTNFYNKSSDNSYIDPIFEYTTRKFSLINYYPESSAVVGGYYFDKIGYIFGDISGVIMIIDKEKSKWVLKHIEKIDDIKIIAFSKIGNDLYLLGKKDFSLKGEGFIYKIDFN